MRRRVTRRLTRIQVIWHSGTIFTNFEPHWSALKIETDKRIANINLFGGLRVKLGGVKFDVFSISFLDLPRGDKRKRGCNRSCTVVRRRYCGNEWYSCRVWIYSALKKLWFMENVKLAKLRFLLNWTHGMLLYAKFSAKIAPQMSNNMVRISDPAFSWDLISTRIVRTLVRSLSMYRLLYILGFHKI